MIQGPITHPQLLAALAEAGHGTRILIADGNYPVTTGAPAGARRVYLNLRRGLPSVPEVLAAIAASVPIESADVMVPDDAPEPPVLQELARLLPGLELLRHGRHAFYDEARRPEVGVVVATGEARTFANILLTIGVVQS